MSVLAFSAFTYFRLLKVCTSIFFWHVTSRQDTSSQYQNNYLDQTQIQTARCFAWVYEFESEYLSTQAKYQQIVRWQIASSCPECLFFYILETNTLEEKRWLLTKLLSLQLVNSLNFSFRPPTAICRTGGEEEDKWRTLLNCGLFSRKLTVGSAVVLQTDNCQPPTAIFAILLFPQECPLQETKTNWRRRGGCHQNCDMFSW